MADGHRPMSTTGFIGSGYLPPPRLSEREKLDVESALDAIEAALVPARKDETIAELAKLAVVCRVEDRSEKAWAVFFDAMAEDMSEYPIDIVEESCRRWRRSSKFFPTISDMIQIASPLLARRRTQRERLLMLSRVAKNPAPYGDVTLEWYRMIRSGAPI